MWVNRFLLYLTSLVLLLLTVSLTACRLEVTFQPTDTPSAASPANAAWAAPAQPLLLPKITPGVISPASSDAPVEPVSASTPARAQPTRPLPAPAPTTHSPNPPAATPPEWLSIPAIDLEINVEQTVWRVVNLHGTQVSTWVVPQNAAGWHENSALPGQGSNVVISGHHNRGAEVFRNLAEVEVGDNLILRAGGRDYRYTITDRLILPELGAPEAQRQQNGQWILPTLTERVTLVTCWPYQGNSHRLIVVAKPAGPSAAMADLP